MTLAARDGLPLHFVDLGPGRRGGRARRWARDVAALYPGATCHSWHGEALRNQLDLGFGEEVVAAFDAPPSPAYAAALSSWCLLHQFGGLYHEAGLRVLGPLQVPDAAGLAAFNDVRASARGWLAIDPRLLWSCPGRREWTLAIAAMLAAWRAEPCRLPLGPTVLGHAFGRAVVERGGGSEDDQWIGQVQAVPATVAGEDGAFVAPDGTVIALAGR